ncbi:MAG: toxin-antitoxin system HicB family antitoxin [Clostridia bacterium]|nr:toxin-antitoxin system HicB family antitoxin [Clostridia bacterium]
MFKIKKEEYVNKTFRMPSELVKSLSEIAQEEKISLNNLVVQCCEYSLKNLKK